MERRNRIERNTPRRDREMIKRREKASVSPYQKRKNKTSKKGEILHAPNQQKKKKRKNSGGRIFTQRKVQDHRVFSSLPGCKKGFRQEGWLREGGPGGKWKENFKK